MPAVRRTFLLAAALLVAGAATAQTPPRTESDVVVTGTLEREQEIEAFVRALTPGPMTGQIGRFEDAICPAAMGLSAEARAAVEARMRRIAVAVGLRVARTDDGRTCTPNVLLMITRDKRQLIEALAARHPSFFGDERETRARQVARQPGPASAWHATTQVNADGRPLPMQGGFYVNQSTRAGGRIVAPTRPAFFAAAVVIEREALPGLTINQLADYAMMRALARTDPHQLPPGSPRTILSVLEAAPDAEVPASITRWDLGFLRGLYASTANLRTPQQRGEIRERVATELDGTARPQN